MTQHNSTKKMKRKILFLSPMPPPYYGASILCERCLDILRKSKEFEVRNIKLNYSVAMSDVGRINQRKIRGIWDVRGQIIKSLNEFKPDLVYMAPATSGLGLIRDSFFARIIKKKGVKILYHVHSRLTRGDRRNILFKKLFESMFHKEKAIILGKELRNDMSWVIPDKDIYILPNAIKNEISNNEILGIQKRRRDARAINILFLSNMDKTKGWPKLLEACKILKERGINFSCNFVGAWVAKRDEECFIDFVKKNSLERNVSYLGKKTGAEKNKVFANANVFVFPTEYKLETFGLVILEAMMFALPVISNSIATIPSTIQDEKSGFVLKSNSPNEIAAKLSILASDRNKMESMGNFGRRLFLKKFEQKKYDKELIRIINSSLGTSS